MRPTSRDEAFAEFVRHRRGHLLAVATTLAAGDRHLAEDLVQTVLVRMYLRWPRLARVENVDAYARRALVNALIDQRRTPAAARERTDAEVPEHPAAPTAALDEDLLDALRLLPPRMRAVVVLRHVHDISVQECAQALGCSEGNVKSQTARGLAKLRELLPTPVPHPSTGELS